MESIIQRALKMVQARKEAASAQFQDAHPDDTINVAFADEGESKAILSGFDIDYDELNDLVRIVGRNLSVTCAAVGQPVEMWMGLAFREGVLVGMMIGKIATDDTKARGHDDV